MKMNEKPDCQNPKCNNKANMLYSGVFMCGDCIMKLEKMKQQQIIDKVMML